MDEMAKNADASSAAGGVGKNNMSASRAGRKPIGWILQEKRKRGANTQQTSQAQKKMKLSVPSSKVSTLSGPQPETVLNLTRRSTPLLPVFGEPVPAALGIGAAAVAAGLDPPIPPGAIPGSAESKLIGPLEAYKLDGLVSCVVDAHMPANLAHTISLQQRMTAARPIKTTEHVQPTIGTGTPLLAQREEESARKQKEGKGKKPSASPPVESRPQRTHLDESELHERAMTYFSNPNNEYTTISALQRSVGATTSSISKWVRENCVRAGEEAGVNKGLYTLKPEYKVASQPEATTSTTAMAGAGAMTMGQSTAPRGPSSSVDVKLKVEPQVKDERTQ